MLKKPIVIDFQEGISNYNGKFERLVNTDLNTIEGTLLVNTKNTNISIPANSIGANEFTANTDDVITIDNSFYVTGQAVQLTTTGTLPAPLATSTTYYVIRINSTTFKLATTIYNADNSVAINITDTGTGTHTVTAVTMGAIIKLIRNPQALGTDYTTYAIDTSGKVWVNYNNYYTLLTGNTAGAILGAEIYKNYLFIFTSTKIHVYGSLTNVGNTATWTNNWQTIDSDSSYHPSIASQDDLMYIGAGRYVVSLEEETTFDPADAGTYTFTAQALNLPENYRIKTLAELGQFLAIGTWMGANVFDLKVADIFLWDRTAPTFELPIKNDENGINAMVSDGNLLYYVAGHNGEIYVTNGTSKELFYKLPKSFFHTTNEYSLYFEPNAIMIHQGRLYIGVGSYTTGNTDIYPLGVISIDLRTKKFVFENTISTGNEGNGNSIRINALLSVSEYYYLTAWTDESVTQEYGIDSNYSNRCLYTNYTAYAETGFYQIGKSKKAETLTEYEINLARKLRPNQVIRLQYRNSSLDSWTTIGTFSYAEDGAKMSKCITNSGVEGVNVQFRVDFDFSVADTESTQLRNIIIS